jgi:hypothetical protein
VTQQLALDTPAATPAAGPRPLVIGLDVALVNSGVAGPDWTDHIRTKTLRGEARLDAILTAAQTFYRNADLAVIEAPAFGRALQAGHDEMAAARWIIRLDLHRRRIPCAVVNPMSRTIYATGTARPKHPVSGRMLTAAEAKAEVRNAVRERSGIHTAGATTHARALDGVAWPANAPLAAR